MADTDTQNTDVSAQLSPPVTPAAATPAPQQIGDHKAINANADKTEAALHQVNQNFTARRSSTSGKTAYRLT